MLQGDEIVDEATFIDEQFVLSIGEDNQTVSLRKLSDLNINLLYFEADQHITWSLYLHERLLSSPIYHLTIGGVSKCSYEAYINGTVSMESGNLWKFNKFEEINESQVNDLKDRYISLTRSIYSL